MSINTTVIVFSVDICQRHFDSSSYFTIFCNHPFDSNYKTHKHAQNMSFQRYVKIFSLSALASWRSFIFGFVVCCCLSGSISFPLCLIWEKQFKGNLKSLLVWSSLLWTSVSSPSLSSSTIWFHWSDLSFGLVGNTSHLNWTDHRHQTTNLDHKNKHQNHLNIMSILTAASMCGHFSWPHYNDKGYDIVIEFRKLWMRVKPSEHLLYECMLCKMLSGDCLHLCKTIVVIKQ